MSRFEERERAAKEAESYEGAPKQREHGRIRRFFKDLLVRRTSTKR